MAKRKKKKIRKEKRTPKRFYKNIAIGVLLGSFSAYVYLVSEKIEKVVSSFYDSSIKTIGFKVESICTNVGKVNPQLEEKIKKQISITTGDNIFKISSHEIHENVMKVSNVKSAVVRKKLPNVIDIDIIEKTPIAIFQKESKFYLIDKDGSTINEISARINKLPIITGDDSNVEANSFLDILSKFPLIKDNLNSMMFIRKRRWDIIIFDGLHVKLPQTNVESALQILCVILKQGTINSQTVKSIDLRMPDNVIIGGLKIKGKAI